MENHINQSPAIPKWSALLIEAVTKPGLIMKAYSAFHPTLLRGKSNSRARAMPIARITARSH
jgi:hypothetical protein